MPMMRNGHSREKKRVVVEVEIRAHVWLLNSIWIPLHNGARLRVRLAWPFGTRQYNKLLHVRCYIVHPGSPLMSTVEARW